MEVLYKTRPSMNKKYDYIIAGAGLGGLSLLYRLMKDEVFSNKQILVIDGVKKTENDRTWCYWEKGEGIFESIVHHSWDTLSFFAPDLSKTFTMNSYRYKMILSDTFYHFVQSLALHHKNITFQTATINSIYSDENLGYVQVGEDTHSADYIFNSTGLFNPEMDTKNTLLQHFLGWQIKVDKPLFNPNQATLMDFTLNQSHGTTFMYMLPTSPDQALVEYTLFSEKVLKREEYERELKDYIETKLGISTYEVIHDEFGVIPMSLARFQRTADKEHRIINLGTAGGFTKASTGYTFPFVQKHLDKVVFNLKMGKSPAVKKEFHDKMYEWYDRTLLDVLLTGKMEGRDIFAKLFKNVKPEKVLAFLVNESTFWEEFEIRNSVPILIFAGSGIKQLF